jgi:amino acid transporter
MSLQPENGDLAEKHAKDESATPGEGYSNRDPENMVEVNVNPLHQDLKGRHMQMIAMQVSAH